MGWGSNPLCWKKKCSEWAKSVSQTSVHSTKNTRGIIHLGGLLGNEGEVTDSPHEGNSQNTHVFHPYSGRAAQLYADKHYNEPSIFKTTTRRRFTAHSQNLALIFCKNVQWMTVNRPWSVIRHARRRGYLPTRHLDEWKINITLDLCGETRFCSV